THDAPLGCAMMIVPGEVERAVDDEPRELAALAHAKAPRLLAHPIERHDEIALDRPRARSRGRRFLHLGVLERQDVGRAILAAVTAIELAQQRVVREHDRDVAGPPTL